MWQWLALPFAGILLSISTFKNDIADIWELCSENDNFVPSWVDLFYVLLNISEIATKTLAIYGYFTNSKNILWCVLLTPVIKFFMLMTILAAGYQVPGQDLSYLQNMSLLIQELGYAITIQILFKVFLVVDNTAIIIAATPTKAVLEAIDEGDFDESLARIADIPNAKRIPATILAQGLIYSLIILYQCWLLSLVLPMKNLTKAISSWSPLNSRRQQTKKAFIKPKPNSLFGLCSIGDFASVKRLIDKNKDRIAINERDAYSGDTLLHKLCGAGQTDLIKQVLAIFVKKVNLRAKNCNQMTPLDVAITNDQHEVVKTLLACKEQTKVDRTTLNMSMSCSFEITQAVYNAFKKHDKLNSKLNAVINMYFDLAKLTNPDVAAEERMVKYKRLLIREIPLSSIVPGSKHKKTAHPSKVKKVSRTIDQDIINDFKFINCSKIMKSPLKIFACSNDHYLCSGCVDQKSINDCVVCLENFKVTPPRRRISAEKIIQDFYVG